MSIYCEQCGTALDADAQFCHDCGSPVPGEPKTILDIEPPAIGVNDPLVGVEPAPATRLANGPSAKEDLAAASLGVVQTWGVVAIRHASDGTWGSKEGLLFPVPLEERDTIKTEQRDGSVRNLNCVAIAVRLPGEKRPIMRARDIRGRVLITESRITVACSKYEQGGGWWGVGGGALLALPLNAGSHALAAVRRRGKMLVGQVRYPWIEGVYGQNKEGFKGTEVLRVIVNLGGTKRVHLQLTLPNNVDAAAVATELIRRAAQFRLAHDPDPLEDAQREKLANLANLEPLVYVKGTGKMAGEMFPTSWPLSGRSASFGLKTEVSS